MLKLPVKFYEICEQLVNIRVKKTLGLLFSDTVHVSHTSSFYYYRPLILLNIIVTKAAVFQ